MKPVAAAKRKTQVLPMYAIYHNPSDFPGKFVVRRFLISDVALADRNPWIVTETLEKARRTIPQYGLVCLGRSTGDDPVIVETWF